MDFEFKVKTKSDTEIIYKFSDVFYEPDSLDVVVANFKRFLYAAGYDIDEIEEK